MPDLRLRLLELTRDDPTFDIDRLGVQGNVSFEAELVGLSGVGIVSRSSGTWTMDRVQRVRLAEQLIHNGADPKRVSRLLGWQEFEDFAKQTLTKNGFRAEKHVVFKTSEGRREIDILAWNDTFTLAVDCKLWRRDLSTGSMKRAAAAQLERVIALAGRMDLLYRLKMGSPETRRIIPVILSLGEIHDRLVDMVPVVPVSKLVSFIYGLSPIDDNIKRVPVTGHGTQTRLA